VYGTRKVTVVPWPCVPLKARQQLGQMLEEVYYRGDHSIIERAGKPMAAVVPVWQFEEWQQHREQFFAMLDAVHARNAEVPKDECCMSGPTAPLAWVHRAEEDWLLARGPVACSVG
jgi:prevent-host-death family protein